MGKGNWCEAEALGKIGKKGTGDVVRMKGSQKDGNPGKGTNPSGNPDC